MDPEHAIQQWLEFATSAHHPGVAPQRPSYSALELVDTLAAEADSLFLFARQAGLDFSRLLPELANHATPRGAGSEHKVFKIGSGKSARVIKITHSGKFGRREHTPQLYLRRWALLNELAPEVHARLEDCLKPPDNGDPAIIVSMSYFQGPHPTLEETDHFIRNHLGYVPLRDASTTLDYISKDRRIILRDCHAKNWIKAQNILVPIDIIPEFAPP